MRAKGERWVFETSGENVATRNSVRADRLDVPKITPVIRLAQNFITVVYIAAVDIFVSPVPVLTHAF